MYLKKFLMNPKQNQYISFLSKYIPVGDAMLWILAYATYVHSIDDIIDNEIPNEESNHQFVLKTFEFAETVYTSIYYLSNIDRLRPLVKMASQCYMDSVALMKSNKPHHKQISDALRCSGNEVILAVVEIENGIEVRAKASLELREISYNTHHNELGAPV